jgi:phosphatidylserine/phosphatidylglycerophosphate/cardiolipin synthase-like enzyme
MRKERVSERVRPADGDTRPLGRAANGRRSAIARAQRCSDLVDTCAAPAVIMVAVGDRGNLGQRRRTVGTGHRCEFASALAERATAGRKVKILLDAIGSASIGPEILNQLEAGGCQVAWYNAIRWYTLRRFNNRPHRESLIVDGRGAFTAGAGIADHWRGNARGADDGATCRFVWRALRWSRSRPGLRTIGNRRPASS